MTQLLTSGLLKRLSKFPALGWSEALRHVSEQSLFSLKKWQWKVARWLEDGSKMFETRGRFEQILHLANHVWLLPLGTRESIFSVNPTHKEKKVSSRGPSYCSLREQNPGVTGTLASSPSFGVQSTSEGSGLNRVAAELTCRALSCRPNS